MILFPNCKINIGLDILSRRQDGFHNIDTAMMPVRGLCDILEIVKSDAGTEFSSSGITVDCPPENNICTKAYNLLAERYGIGSVRMHLHKVIPFGAGLGGGSADAAFSIRGLNDLFALGLEMPTMESLAAELGSDTAFFIRNTPQMAQGRGEKLTPIDLDLGGRTLVLVKPGIGISTAEAYSGVCPQTPSRPLAERILDGIDTWRTNITNGFERHTFDAHPELDAIKESLYALGAVYASMSGSGSAMYGIFDTPPHNPAQTFPGMFVHSEVIA